MLRDITLGQYYQKDSVIHRLDPRTKIAAAALYIVLLFCIRDFGGYAVAAVFAGGAIAASRVPLRFIVRGMKPVAVILVITFLINIFLYPGTVLAAAGPLKITEEGLRQACFMALRLLMLVFGTSLLTYTTKPMQLTDGFEAVLSPLSRLGFPSHEIAVMMSIALRFIPMLIQEADKIMKAQQARGADFESGNLLQRMKSMIPLLVPLFVGAFRIAQDLAMAMEARCYRGGEGRTRLYSMKFQRRDAAAAAVLLIFAAAILAEPFIFRQISGLW